MKRLISTAVFCLAVALVASACDDNGPGAPPTGGSNIPNPTFRATLSPANEVPPVSNAEAGASGTMDITIVATRDSAGAIIAAGVNFSGTLSGFPAGTVITASHIHGGVAGVNGGVLVNLGLTAGEITLTTGGGTIVKSNIALTTDLANQIIANPSAFYFNAHTAANPGGAVRGQLVRTN
jgi:hypothetical protein